MSSQPNKSDRQEPYHQPAQQRQQQQLLPDGPHTTSLRTAETDDMSTARPGATAVPGSDFIRTGTGTNEEGSSLPVARPANQDSHTQEIDEERIVEQLRNNVIQPLLDAANEAKGTTTTTTQNGAAATSSIPIAQPEKLFESSQSPSSGRGQGNRTRDSRSGRKICGLKSSLFYAVVLGAVAIAAIVIGTAVGIYVSNNGTSDDSMQDPSITPPQPTESPSNNLRDTPTPAPQNNIMTTTSPTDPPSGSPTEEPFSARFESLLALLEPIITINGHLLQDETSVQHKALLWLADEDPANLDVDTTSTVVLLERYVVVVLYMGTGGSLWREQYNFLSGEPVCGWGGDGASAGFPDTRQGIQCIVVRGDISIREIRLRNNFLVGELPADLGMLQNIENLVIGDNFLSGIIPTDIFMASTLVAIEFAENSFVGTIPTEIGQLTNSLKYIDVSTNSLTGMVPIQQFAQLSNTLANLVLSLNEFDEWSLPNNIGQLSKLTHLGLSATQLTGTIPDELGNCTSMTAMFAVLNTQLIGTIPTTLAQMTDLVDLNIWTTDISGTVPTEFGTMTQLTRLDLSDTKITGSVNTLFCEPMPFPNIVYFAFDCLADPPEIECSCCTRCFDCPR